MKDHEPLKHPGYDDDIQAITSWTLCISRARKLRPLHVGVLLRVRSLEAEYTQINHRQSSRQKGLLGVVLSVRQINTWKRDLLGSEDQTGMLSAWEDAEYACKKTNDISDSAKSQPTS